jgi:hypothetical protein
MKTILKFALTIVISLVILIMCSCNNLHISDKLVIKSKESMERGSKYMYSFTRGDLKLHSSQEFNVGDTLYFTNKR